MQSVYLHQLDIDEYGAPMPIKDNDLDKYLMLYALFFNGVVLQSSSALKRNDVSNFFIRHSDLFISKEGRSPLISLALESPDELYTGYLEKRKSALTKIVGYQRNSEYKAYKNADADITARLLDSKIPKSDIYITQTSVDAIFRKKLSEFNEIELNRFLDRKDVNGITEIVRNFAINDEFCQTFVILERLEKKYPLIMKSSLIKDIGEAIRKRYYIANMVSNGCYVMRKNKQTRHLDYDMLRYFSALIDLDSIFTNSSLIDGFLLTRIKHDPIFNNLITIYFSTSPNIIYTFYLQYRRENKFFSSKKYSRYFDKEFINQNFFKLRNEFLKRLDEYAPHRRRRNEE